MYRFNLFLIFGVLKGFVQFIERFSEIPIVSFCLNMIYVAFSVNCLRRIIDHLAKNGYNCFIAEIAASGVIVDARVYTYAICLAQMSKEKRVEHEQK